MIECVSWRTVEVEPEPLVRIGLNFKIEPAHTPGATV